MIINKLESNPNWFVTGIPEASLVAPWQLSNDDTFRQYQNETSIHYKTNSKGYRDIEWTADDLNNSIWCVGHSDVVGVGVPLEDIWSKQLSKLTNIKTVNLGTVGGAWDTAARIIYCGLKQYKPKLIIIQSIFKERREYISDNFHQVVSPSMAEERLPHDEVWKYIDDTNSQYCYEKNLALIEASCKATGVGFVIFDIKNRWKLLETDSAADGKHIGIKTHLAIAEELVPYVTETLNPSTSPVDLR
jgi:hypothetical protein